MQLASREKNMKDCMVWMVFSVDYTVEIVHIENEQVSGLSRINLESTELSSWTFNRQVIISYVLSGRTK